MNCVRVASCLALAALAFLTGCGPSSGGRQEVSGTIKLKGQPLDQGVIDFTPVESQATKGGAVITNGSYKIPRALGLLTGKYHVTITAGDGRTKANSEEPPGPT